MKSSKIAITLILSILFTCKLFSQSSTDLDAKMGFKDFTLGDGYSKWSSNLTLINTSDGIKTYQYNGSCCQQVFAYDLEQIALGFKNDKLIFIYLLTKQFKAPTYSYPRPVYNSIKNSFYRLFGSSTEYLNKDKNLESIWEGTKVFMTLTDFYLGVKSEGDEVYNAYKCSIYIWLKSDLGSGF